MLKIRRPLGRLIFNMGIAIPGKTVFLIETAPCCRLGFLGFVIMNTMNYKWHRFMKIQNVLLPLMAILYIIFPERHIYIILSYLIFLCMACYFYKLYSMSNLTGCKVHYKSCPYRLYKEAFSHIFNKSHGSGNGHLKEMTHSCLKSYRFMTNGL